jgi:ligand-binding sensor domain-containing protein
MALALGGGDTIWMASEYQLWLHTAGSWQPVMRPDDGKGGTITSLLVDSSGALWVGARTGLARMAHGRTHVWRMSEGLPSATVLALARRGRDGVWVGTERGLVAVSGRGSVLPVAMDSGGRARVDAIAMDRTGRHWLAGAYGVRLVSVQRGSPNCAAMRTELRRCRRRRTTWRRRHLPPDQAVDHVLPPQGREPC